MVLDKNTAKKTAQVLLDAKAIKLQPQSPFTWASGWKSPIYCDNRITLSFPETRTYLKNTFASLIKEQFKEYDLIAGVATGAIAIGALVADALNKPFVYVRPEPKKHGRQNQIEGSFNKGQKVIVIEDLISTGKSSLQAIDAIKNAGLEVLNLVAIFSYGFEIAKENFDKAEVPYQTLSDYSFLLEAAIQSNYIREEQLGTLGEWRKSPDTWKP